MNRDPSKPNKTDLHRRLTNFVRWIAPEPEKEDDIRARGENVRTVIKNKASDEKLVVKSTPSSGSFATRTGLRRHMRGKSEVEGQDVDVPFVIAPMTKDDEKLTNLLSRFERYAKASYPETARDTTKSSVRLMFDDNLNFDLVPLLATSDPERQILIRSDGERRETSVQKHVEFVRKRTAASNAIKGVVKFNEMVRLLKWFRCYRLSLESGTLTDVPSFLIILLAAHVFDARGVKATYGETLVDWFGHIARVIRQQQQVSFTDYARTVPPAQAGTWSVDDPANGDNNVVSKMTYLEIEELGDWFEEARDEMLNAMVAFEDDREGDGMEALATIFGNAIRHHSESEP
jgi:hypothetical protein